MRGLARVDGDSEYIVYVRDARSARAMFSEHTFFDFRLVRPKSIWLRFPIGLPPALRRDPVDLLHVQYFAPPASRCPVVLTAHDISFAVHPEFFVVKDRLFLGTLVPWSLRRADRIITDTEFTKQEMVRTYGLEPSRIAVIPLAADPRYRPMDRDESVRFVADHHGITDGFVLYVGTLQPQKNIATLMRVFCSAMCLAAASRASVTASGPS